MPFLALLVENVNFEQTITPKLNMAREAQEGRRGGAGDCQVCIRGGGMEGMLP